jgi:hypothetical protein
MGIIVRLLDMTAPHLVFAGKLEELSVQQILDCAPNPQQCGGTCHVMCACRVHACQAATVPSLVAAEVIIDL